MILEILNSILNAIGLQTKKLELKNYSRIISLITRVRTAGTAVQLPNQAIPDGIEVLISALVLNTGTVYIGEGKAFAEDRNRAYPLAAGTGVELRIKNLDSIWLDSDNDNDGVAWLVENEDEVDG